MNLLFMGLGILSAAPENIDLIYTEGGGVLLEQAFAAIGKILYGEGSKIEKTFHVLLRVSLSVGAFCAACMAFFRQKFEPLIKSFLLPGLVIIGFLLVPTTTVQIEDSLNPKEKKTELVVPFSLGKFASWTSYSFNRLSHLFKRALQDQYPWVANIYAEKNFFRRGAISSDKALEENFRNFCHECVFRDLGLGLYDKNGAEKFEESSDLFKYLEQNTSKNRSVVYQGALISCENALKNIHEQLKGKAVEGSADEILLLLGKNEKEAPDLSQLAMQKFAIDHIEKEVYGVKEERQSPSFGAQGTVLILSLRNFFEAVLYLSFPLVLLFSLLSFGIRTLIQWLRVCLWISTWPIFYAAVDLFLNSIWNFRMKNDHGLVYSLDTANKFSKFLPQMEMIAFLALASLPFLCWFLIKGGLAQLVHLASEIPLHPAPESKFEAKRPEHSLAAIEANDVSRQTYDGHAALETKAQQHPEESGFQSVVDSSRAEERMDSLSSSLSSIRSAVKDSGEDVSKAIKGACPPLPSSTFSPVVPVKVEEWPEEHRAGTSMHNPSHGSWSSQ
jgi:hypothetical protein